MIILSCNPQNNEFFIGASFKEFKELREIHNFVNGDFNYKDARIRKKRNEIEPENNYYENLIKGMYNIDFVPDICFVCNKELTKFVIMKHSYPYNYKWADFSPWKNIERTKINSLEELKRIEFPIEETKKEN